MYRSNKSLCYITGANIVFQINYFSKTNQPTNRLRKKEIRFMIIRGLGGGMKNGMKAIKRHKLPVIRWISTRDVMGFPGVLVGKESAWNAGNHLQCRRPRFSPWVRKIPWRRKWQQLQYSCLENPMDRGAWLDMTHRVSKSQTQLKQLTMRAHLYIKAK